MFQEYTAIISDLLRLHFMTTIFDNPSDKHLDAATSVIVGILLLIAIATVFYTYVLPNLQAEEQKTTYTAVSASLAQ